MKKIFIFFIVGLVALSIFGYLKFDSGRALAASEGDDDDVDLHIKVEGSVDHGTTWFNFSGTEGDGGDTITAIPGEQIDFRVKVWNTDTFQAFNTDIIGGVTNVDYVSGLNFTASDFIGYTFEAGGGGTAINVPSGSTEDANFQKVEGTIQLAATFPVGQTLIVGNVTITDYDPTEVVFSPSRFVARALGIKQASAQGVNRQSALRIAVNVAAPSGGSSGTKVISTPTPSLNSTPSPETIITLPETGGSIIEDTF